MPYSVNLPEVTLTLRAEDDEIGTRTIVLNSHNWSVQIGRGSQTEEHLRPQFNNAWFGSRVMSRAHADITVDPITREVVLTDIGSMHGTYIDGRRLQPHEQAILGQGKVITFGADILRGELTYQALQLKISYQWSDEYAARMQHWQSGLKAPSLILDESRSTCRDPTTKNSYSLDYSDDEPMSDQSSDREVEVIYESAVQRDCTISAHVSKQLDDVSASSSCIAEQREDSAPTSPAKEHVAHKVEVLSSHPRDGSVIVLEEEQSDAKAMELPQSSTQQSSHQDQAHQFQDRSGPVHVHTETIDLLSEMSSSDEEDEGYAELDNFSELESEQDWNNQNTTSAETASSIESEDKFANQNRPGSPSDAAMPKVVTCGTSALIGELRSERSRGFPELYAPLSTPSSLPMSCYGNDQNTAFPSMISCGFNKLPSIQSAPWWDQGLDFSAPPAYKFAPAAFGYQGHPLPVTPVKVSINSILDEEPADSAISNKRKREAEDVDQIEQVKKTITSVTGDVSENSTITIATTSYAHEAESIGLQPVSHNPGVLEGAPSNSAEAPQQIQNLTNEVSMPATSSRDLEDHELQDLSSGNPGKLRPRKRLRTQGPGVSRSSTGKTIAKYAATALVGAAVGSIGTVFGLAALPAEYFL